MISTGRAPSNWQEDARGRRLEAEKVMQRGRGCVWGGRCEGVKGACVGRGVRAGAEGECEWWM